MEGIVTLILVFWIAIQCYAIMLVIKNYSESKRKIEGHISSQRIMELISTNDKPGVPFDEIIETLQKQGIDLKFKVDTNH